MPIRTRELVCAISCFGASTVLAEHHGTVQHSTASPSSSGQDHGGAAYSVVVAQKAQLAANTEGRGFGPQSPRNIDQLAGINARVFLPAPHYTEMNLCNIHFHENAEHMGGDFTTFAGVGDGHGYGAGYKYNGSLTPAELTPYREGVGEVGHGDLRPGDTIEVHFVHTTAQVEPGPTLGACLSETIKNPQLRVEAQVFVLVNDENALDFRQVASVEKQRGFYQAPRIPNFTGEPAHYAGSTTGPSYNETGSPFQVSWSVRPQVAKLSIQSVDAWLANNIFAEDHAHGVRNLVQNPALLSVVER